MSRTVATNAHGARRTLVVIGLIVVALIAPSPVAATTKAGLFAGAKRVENAVLLRGADQSGSLHLLVTLRTPGIGALRAAGGAGESFAFRGAQIRERMGARAAVAAIGGTIHAEYQYILNGLRVRIPATKLETLRANPNVADVQLVTRYQRTNVTGGAVSNRAGAIPSNASAATEVQAKNVWAQTSTSRAGTGFGIKVAVIDSGIDYTHDLFVRNGDIIFPTPKVPLGYDLVGDDYAPGNGGLAEVPQPDSDPKDCDITAGGGHGTHVAGTVAGYGIKSNGDTYGISPAERYTSSLNISTFRIAPGMAPLATLIAIRVFGCQGGTELTADGIEKAVALGANVINLSLGSSYGIKGGAEQAAINAAERAGVTVVVSAGNDGEQPFLVGAPSTEDGAISVAALNDRATYPAATISYQWFGVPTYVGGGTGAGLLNANVYDLSTPLVKNIHSLKQVGDASLYSLGCPATGDGGMIYTPDWDVTQNLADKIVILRRGECTFKEKADAMIAKGAVAVVILQRADILSGGDTTSYPPFQGPNAPTASIPVLMANGATETALQTALTTYGLEGNEATISNRTAGIANPDYHTVAEFSSGGPRFGDLALKPELAAPGVDIVSAASGSGGGAAWFSGTSMAAPVVAGVAALVKQANPKWTPALIKSALINTSKSIGSSIQLRVVGAGRVNALNAVKAKVTLDAGPNATLSFGMVYGDSSATLTRTKTFIVKNSGTTTAGYRFTAGAAAGFTIPAGVTVRIYSGSLLLKSTTVVYVSPGRSKTLTVRLTATAEAQRRFDPGYTNDMLNVIVSGTSTGRPSLRLPIIAMLRHSERFSFATSGGAPHNYTGTILTGTQDAKTSAGAAIDPMPILPYVWLARDGRERIGNGADIKNIGVNAYQIPSDWASTGSGNGFFEIAITTWESFSNAALHQWVVELDANDDGLADQVLVVGDSGALTTGSPSGTLGCLYVDTLGWNGMVGATYELDSSACEPYAGPVSSTLIVALAQGYFWDTVGGAQFRVSTYNGGGWDSDSSGDSWLYVEFDNVVSAGQWIAALEVAPGLGSASDTAALHTLGFPIVVGGETPSLGWLFWNQWHAGPSSEIYEVLIPSTP